MNKHLIILAAVVALFAGCAHFGTKQRDVRTAKDGTTTEITTKVGATTFFSANSALTKFRASQTEKQQGASVGSYSAEASGTNVVESLRVLDSILEKIR